MKLKTGLVCFGEVNTPYEKLVSLYGEAKKSLLSLDYELGDAGIVIDDSEYKTAGEAVDKLKGFDMCCLIVCVAGWVPTHTVIRVVDEYRHVPIVLWGL